MKKILSAILCAAMLFPHAVSAQSDSMQDALASVKARVNIPAELTEFKSRTFSNDEQSEYYFTWYDKEYKKSLEITCDSEGRIKHYWMSRENLSDDVRLTGYSQNDAKNLAENFLKKAMPEAFSGNDVLICENSSGFLEYGGTNFDFDFIRRKNGIRVGNDNVSVKVTATADGMYVNSIWSDYDYNAEFLEPVSEIEDPETEYKKVFPLDLHYVKDYSASKDSEKDVTKLIYSVSEYGGGYISAENGEKVTQKEEMREFYNAGGNASAKQFSAEASADSAFSEQELVEINNVAGLKTTAEIEKMLRGFEDLNMTGALKLKSSNIYRADDEYIPYPAKEQSIDNVRYVMNLYFTDDSHSRYLSASADARTGEIFSISNNSISVKSNNKTVNDAQKKLACEKIKNFFEAASKTYGEFEVKTVNAYSSVVDVSYARMAKGIEYMDNYASVSYDTENNMITYYSINYSDAEFADPAPAIDAELTSYDTLLKRFPLEKIYILTDSDEYKLCFRMSGYSDINALTGEIEYPENTASGEYTDINGHWCETAVKALAEVGISLSGTEFKPDERITKAELLSFFASGLNNNGYICYPIADVMNEMKRIGVIAPDETIEDGDSPVTREDACVYMIRLAGHEKIAKLDIFKGNFADSNFISPEKFGYAAILAGMKVVSGDGGYLRPTDNLTRAEAAVMLYKYLING